MSYHKVIHYDKTNPPTPLIKEMAALYTEIDYLMEAAGVLLDWALRHKIYVQLMNDVDAKNHTQKLIEARLLLLANPDKYLML
jgi:hypothetical protein